MERNLGNKRRLSGPEEEDEEVSFTPRNLVGKRRREMDPAAAPSIVDELKKHFDAKTEETQRDFRQYMRGIEEKVNENSTNIRNIQKAIERIERKSVSDAPRTPDRSRTAPTTQDLSVEVDDTRLRYMLSRRSIRLWPINGDNCDTMRKDTEKFIFTNLAVSKEEFEMSRIERIRRSKTPRNSKIKNEAIITFTDSSSRDFVVSHAKNLAKFDRDVQIGMRLDYPEFLGNAYRTLEKFGAKMRARNGKEFKRSIKFNDDELTLYMDMKLPGSEEWIQVSPQIASESMAEDEKHKSESVRRIIRANGKTALNGLFREVRRTSEPSSCPPKRHENRRQSTPGSDECFEGDHFVHNRETFYTR